MTEPRDDRYRRPFTPPRNGGHHYPAGTIALGGDSVTRRDIERRAKHID